MAGKRDSKPPANGGGDEFRLEEFVPHRLAVAAQHVARVYSHAYDEGFDLSVAECQVLMTINRFGVMSPGEIIDKATMDKVKISRAASSLTGRGLIRQDVNPRDQRSKQLKVTRKGQGLVQKLVSTSRETEALVSSGVTAAEWATLGRLLAKVNAHMARQQAADDN